MTPTKTLILTAAILAGLALSACSDPNAIPVSTMSCTDLAHEIGRYTQVRDDATIDSLAASVDNLFTDEKEKLITNSVEALAEDITGVDATQRLDVLNRAYAQRGCR